MVVFGIYALANIIIQKREKINKKSEKDKDILILTEIDISHHFLTFAAVFQTDRGNPRRNYEVLTSALTVYKFIPTY